ncbi:MAG TPA: acyltransferase [Rhizomicrobium sp.]|nr:acyltransferase [Rhizomicrobium sp.]
MKSEKPAEIKALSGARAFPPLILVLYHFCEGHHYMGAFWFDAPVAKGYLWVEFFFALSGFILTHVYGGHVHGGRRLDYFAFLKARLSRLYPLHLFMLLVILALVIGLRALASAGGYVSIYDMPYHPVVTLPSFVANLFLVQAWNILPALTWNGASWFVSVEFLLCLLFPLYLYISRGGRLRAVLLIAAGSATLYCLALSSGHGLDLTFHNGIFRGMAGFAIGVGLSMLYREAQSWSALPEGLFTLAQLAALLLLLDAIYRTEWAHKPSDIWVALAMAGLIFTLAFDKGVLARALSAAPVLKLGEWSYAIYMGQTAWLQLLRYFEQRWYPNADPAAIWWAEPLGLLAVCIVWGALLATFVEIPANRFLRRL